MTKPTLGGVFRKLVNLRRRASPSSTNQWVDLAHTMCVPVDVIDRVVDEVNAELKDAENKEDEFDPHSIIDKVGEELRKHARFRKDERGLLMRLVQALPDREYQILYLHRAGTSHRQIAALMNMDLRSVRRLLARVHARLMYPDDHSGNSEPHAIARSSCARSEHAASESQ